MQKNSGVTSFSVTAALFFTVVLVLTGCAQKTDHTRGVYMLVDTSGTYTEELNKARAITNYLLGTLTPGDTMAVARIDTGSFSEKDIIAKVTFDQRPSVANTQKRAFQNQMADFVASVDGSSHTDISGGLLQAVEYLNETGSGHKYILIFSDLKEELARGHVRDVPFQLSGFNIIALNVTKLRDDIRDPKNYLQRVDQWRAKTESGGGAWRVINDLERLDNIFSM
ncbi:hypothetical protein [Desulfosarcina sp.]|uniref:hypothetical protein n=1 Tax=Desulfosarcina sp. TaxID=2027861 RepID=UPI0039710849